MAVYFCHPMGIPEVDCHGKYMKYFRKSQGKFRIFFFFGGGVGMEQVYRFFFYI